MPIKSYYDKITRKLPQVSARECSRSECRLVWSPGQAHHTPHHLLSARPRVCPHHRYRHPLGIRRHLRGAPGDVIVTMSTYNNSPVVRDPAEAARVTESRPPGGERVHHLLVPLPGHGLPHQVPVRPLRVRRQLAWTGEWPIKFFVIFVNYLC